MIGHSIRRQCCTNLSQVGCTGRADRALASDANRRHYNACQCAGDANAKQKLEQRKAEASDLGISAVPARENDKEPGAIMAPRLTDSARLIGSRSLHAKVNTILFSSRSRFREFGAILSATFASPAVEGFFQTGR